MVGIELDKLVWNLGDGSDPESGSSVVDISISALNKPSSFILVILRKFMMAL